MAGYVLYGRNGSGSAVVEAALVEAKVPFELRDVPGDREAAEAEGFMRINPRGQVPALVLPDGTVATEGPATLLHIADAFPASNLAPKPGTSARVTHDRWLCFLHANCYEAELRRFYPDRYTDDPAGAPAVSSAALAYARRHYVLLESEVPLTPFVFGDRISMLDLYLWMLIQWHDPAWASTHCPKIWALAQAIAQRPSIAPLQAKHV
jgi:glutathione S-transferase